jgi:hypothetical protein
MKKIFTLLFLLGIITSGFAQFHDRDNDHRYDDRGRNDYYRNSALVIKAFTEKRFTVIVDNMPYELNADYRGRHDNVINVGALGAGKHSVSILEACSSMWGRQKQREVYCGSIFLKPGMETAVNINNYSQVNISERPMFNNGYGYDDRRGDDRRGDDRWDNNRH